MNTKLHDWRIDEVLQTPEDRAVYIQAAMDEHDPAYLAKALGNVSRIEGEERIAKRAKLTREDLRADFIDGGNPTLRTFMRVIDALGFQMLMRPKAMRDAMRTKLHEQKPEGSLKTPKAATA